MSTIIPAQPGWVVDYQDQILTVIAWKLQDDVLLPMVYSPELSYASTRLPDGGVPVARRLVKEPVSKRWI